MAKKRNGVPSKRDLLAARKEHEAQRRRLYDEEQKRGRPLELTPILQAMICAQIEAGVPAYAAAIANGIARGTFFRWTKAGSRGEQPYRDFLNAIEEADAKAMVGEIAAFQRESKGYWAARLAYLERRWPAQFGARFKQYESLINGAGRPPEGDQQAEEEAIDFSKLSVEELEKVTSKLDEALALIDRSRVIEGTAKRVR